MSEFGKTCARNPLKAEEVITGTLQSVPIDGKIIIESTGEGNDGFYADMVNTSHQRGNEDLSDLDYKLFFFPWYLEEKYRMKKDYKITVDEADYFSEIESKQDVKLDKRQRNWYLFQKSILGDKIKQEFPSTVSESFLSSSDGS